MENEEKEEKEEREPGAEEKNDEEDMWEHDSDYDEQGKYVWGEEGKEWDYYYKEDKEANERGDPVHPQVLNPPMSSGDNELLTMVSSDAKLYRTTKKVKEWKK